MLFAEHVVHLGPCRRVHRDEIGLRQHLGQGRRQHAVIGNQRLLDERIVGHHPQAKRRRAFGDGARHPAERNETKRLSHQPRDFQQSRAALRPAAGAHHLVLLDEAAESGEQQHHGVVGDFLDERVGNVGDGNAARGRGLDVDAVDADAAERDDLAVFQRVDDGFGDRHALGVDRVRGAGGGDEFRLIGRRLDDLGVDRIERLFFIAVAAAGGRETRALRRHYFEFRHFPAPELIFRC